MNNDIVDIMRAAKKQSKKKLRASKSLEPYTDIVILLRNEKNFKFNEIMEFLIKRGVDCTLYDVSNLYHRQLKKQKG